jgi:hypothetical protein
MNIPLRGVKMKKNITCMAVLVVFLLGGILLSSCRDKGIGMRKDGSYYTRIEWASHTEKTPLYWVNNLLDDDIERDGGSYGANTMGPANVVLSFFGETQLVGKVRFFHNVGATISKIEELASDINVYTSEDEKAHRLGGEDADINSVKWTKVLNCKMEKREDWFEFVLDKPVKAKYVRIELVKNFGTPPDLPWTETNEVKIFP